MIDQKQSIVLLSKLQAPQIRTKVLYRKRLIDSLIANLNKKVILICAGAGYGKTTLLSQLLSSRDMPYVYYHLEYSDAEPAVFFSYLIEGIRKYAPDFGKKTEALSHFFNYPQRYLELIMGTFINEMIETFKQDIYIILEDYHTIYPAEHIDKILNFLISHLPQQVHFMISSRVRPPLSIAQLQARDEIFEISGQELKFNKEETKDLFVTVYSVSLTESELEWIEEHLEGWPTSLRLMLQSSNYFEKEKSTRYIKRILDSYYQSQSNLFNYFAQEIYDQESRSIRQFLVDCSVLEWLTPELCNAVARKEDSEYLLAELTTRNAFLVDIPGLGYRFHHLFRDFLYSKLIDKKREKRLYRRAGDFYAREKRVEEAIKFYLRAETYEKAAKIIENIGAGFIGEGKGNILTSYIEDIPKPVRMQRPILLMEYSRALIYGDRADEAIKACQRAVALLRKKKRPRIKYTDALYNLGMIHLNQGSFKIAERRFKKALEACPSGPFSAINRASIINAIGSTYTAMEGRYLFKAKKYFQKALKIAQDNGFTGLEAAVLNNWAMIEFKLGNLIEAYPKLTKIVELLEANFTPGCGAGFFNAANTSLLLGYEDKARSILDRGNKICSNAHDLWSIARIWEGYAQLYIRTGEYKKAKQLTTKALVINEKFGVVNLIVRSLKDLAWINIKNEDFVEAERNLARIWVLKGELKDADAVPFLLNEAELRKAQDRLADAEEILARAMDIARPFKQSYNLFQIYLLQSKIYHGQHRDKEMFSALKQAVKISSQKGYDYLLANELQDNNWMLHGLRRDNTEQKYIMSLIDKYEIDAHRIDAQLFGVPKIMIDEKEIAEASWTTIKSKKLFFYFLLHKHERVAYDVLIEALWQNASHKSGSNSLRKALQHIRQMYKTAQSGRGELIISSKGFYQLSSSVSIRIDTEEFEETVKKIKNMDKADKKYGIMLRKTISLYKQGFAPGWYDPWIEDRRRYFQGLYEDCLFMLADHQILNKKYQDAIINYKKLISMNVFHEEYHRRIMIAYSKVGRYKEIIQDFDKLKKVLKKELDSEPREDIVKLYNSLIIKR
jgi:LuxR family maltose regulon positive regulatory protein